jgi:hypothetical protein
MIDPKDKYKLEYAEVGNLRRHYSNIRSGLTTFCMTASVAALASDISRKPRSSFLAFTGLFMLLVALVTCLVFSYRTEKANVFLREIWRWLDDDTESSGPSRFDDFNVPFRDLFRQMLRDEMNWLMFAAFLVIACAFFLLD